MKRKTIRNRYHSDFKLAVFLGITDYEIIDSLPKSTIHSFRNLSPNEFRSLIGHSYSDSQFFDPEYLMLLKKIANAKTFIRILKAALRAKKCLLSIQRFPQRIAYDLQTKERIIRTIEKIRDTIGFEKSLRYFNISKAAYYLWLFEFRSQCDAAVSNLCLRRFPLQISNSEIEALKRLVYEKIQLGWPFSVIWGYGVRHRIIRFSKSTFMRYVRALGLLFTSEQIQKNQKNRFLNVRA